MKKTMCLLSVPVMFCALALKSQAFMDDFNDGNLDGWKVQAENWKVEKGEVKFSAGGNCGASLYYENGAEWTDYEFQVDLKLANLSDFPGGIRVRLNPKSGESYFTWVYPAQKIIISYVAIAWDCNANKGQAARDVWQPPKVGEWGQLKMVVTGDVIESWWNGKKVLSIKDGSWKKGTIALMTFNQDVFFDNVRVSGKGIPLSQGEAVEPDGKVTTTWGTLKTSHIW